MNNNYIKTSSAKLSDVSYEKVKNEAGFFFEVELTIGDKLRKSTFVIEFFQNSTTKKYVYLRKNLLVRWFVDF